MKKIALLMLAALPLLFVLISYSAAQGPTPRPDFAIACEPNTLTTHAGTPVLFTGGSITSINHFAGTIELACATAAPGLVCSVPGTTKLGADQKASFAIYATPGLTTVPGTYPIIIGATGIPSTPEGKVSHSTVVYLTVEAR